MITLEQLKQYCIDSNKKVDSELLEKTICTQEDASRTRLNLPSHYYRLFYHLAKVLKPKLVLELGTYTGISSACFAVGNPEGKVITVDHKERVMPSCLETNIEHLVQDSLVLVDVKEIDILFLDTLHDGIMVAKEYEIYKNRMSKNSLIFLDDIFLTEGMRNFWKGFNPGGQKAELPSHGQVGFGVIINGMS